ncbi:hypothetical protein GN244_ATG06319 [Phytophthora infestans]|uniref:Secreted RxLR effector peptide protein n=1 Tax=Phytophthora infestans TaxID=4787 RepID=A0A833W3Y9_PHYIN|nr:hypothetical protein GN244_ATG06319 [Phytophthora infestans]KAF4127647.1 hypothetical protein GN958_ATG23133 [Phytophthora infestans]KAF4130969.1 hypothetical protein GN958_ATG19819 [Phytophthora infestans]KAF4148694.1 hypothetical protein GN958_ATG02115 [Phytophthora infestans]
MATATSMFFLLIAAWTAMQSLSAAEEIKVSEDLLRAVQSDYEARVDILVQLASPSQALQDSCDRSALSAVGRSQRASCVAETMQNFAEQTQQPVKDLLDRNSDLFSTSTFLWISNSVAVKDACGELVMELARLDAVEKIDLEQVFEIQAGGDMVAAE